MKGKFIARPSTRVGAENSMDEISFDFPLLQLQPTSAKNAFNSNESKLMIQKYLLWLFHSDLNI
jgi:hypothetical protein